jgi:PPOX class probable F420-dependent enzyme
VTSLDDVAGLVAAEQGLAVVATLRADSTIQASLVNAAVMDHPATGSGTVAFVTYGQVKLANLRARPQAVLTFRSGWRWASVEGRAELLGPDDGVIGAEDLRQLLRAVFVAAGGTHDDWAEYDRVMLEQRRTVVLVTPTKIYSN